MTTLVVKLILLINLIIFNYIEATPITTEDVVSEKDLKSYLEIIKSRTDLTKDPCNDFSIYACGNMDLNSKVKTTNKLATFVEPMFIKNEPQNESERKVRDLHLSCMKMMSETEDNELQRIKHILEQVPDIKFYSDDKTITNKNIARMFVKLHLLAGQEQPINIDFYFSQLKIVALPNHHESNIESVLRTANYEDGIEDIKKFTKQIISFVKGWREDEDYDYIKTKVKSIDELKTLVPSNHINWDEIYNEFKDEFGSIKTEIIVENIELLKKLIEIIDATDKHTVMNYLTLRYIEFLSKIDCYILDYFYRYAVLSRLWDDNFSDETTVNRFVTFLDEFEKSFNDSQKTLKYENINSVYEKLNSKRDVAKNYKIILPDKVRDDFYKNCDIDVNYFYKNLLEVFKLYVKDIHNYDYENEKVQNSVKFRLKRGYYDETIKTNIKNMPYIQSYSTIGFDLWNHIIGREKPSFLIDFDFKKVCSNTIVYKNLFAYDFQYSIGFPSQKLTYLGMLHDSENINSKLHKEKELIESKHIDKDFKDLKKLYFTVLAQYRCESGETKLTDNIFKILQDTIEFSDIFKCPANSQMNKTPTC